MSRVEESADPGAHLKAFIIRYVYREIGFIPVHLAAMQSEAHFHGVESELPLLVLWGEQERRDSYSFRTWTNWDKVVEIAGKFDGPTEGLEDPAVVRAALSGAYEDIGKVATAAIYDLCGKSGKAPSQICDDYWFPSGS